MDENTIRNPLFRLAVIICLIGGILLASGVGVISYAMRSVHDDIHEQMKVEAQEYKNHIFKQFDKDLQILGTLASIFSMDHIFYSGTDNIMTWITKANSAYNDFVSIAYFTLDGAGMVNTFGTEFNSDYPLGSCNESIQVAVKKAFAGEQAISRFFVSEITDGQLYVYSVPIWYEGKIIGALAASSRLDIFDEIANDNMVMGGNGFVHLIGSEGKFLVRSSKSVVPMIQEYTTIFDGPYIAGKNQADILDMMKKQQSGFYEFNYGEKSYHFYLQPLGINDWYLMCVDTMWGNSPYIYQIFFVMGGSYFLMLILSCFLLFYGYSIIRKNYNNLIKLAYFDQVTGAENFARFEKRLSACRKQTDEYSVVAANMRNFKFINELFGKEDGNLLLNYLRKQFDLCMKENEFFCRDNADQFYLLLRDTNQTKIKARLQDIISRVNEDVRKNGRGFHVNIYFGVSISGDTHQALLAQQHIRQNSNQQVHFYDDDIHKTELKNHYIESHMDQALESGAFKLYLQPKMRLSDGIVAGAEALVRWQTDDGQFLYPGEFIPLFEANGFCARLDLYMVECACRQLREWLDNGIKPIPISVNQSRLLFMENHYVDALKRLLDKYQISAALIVLEILEGLAAENLEVLNNRIDQLQSAGFKVSMDDFGSGYSSLNTLYQLKLDELKIDRAFLCATSQENDEMRFIVLKQIIQLAKKLNITTVIEGIETKENAEMMVSFGCEYGQGYYYSKPISAKEFTQTYMQ